MNAKTPTQGMEPWKRDMIERIEELHEKTEVLVEWIELPPKELNQLKWKYGFVEGVAAGRRGLCNALLKALERSKTGTIDARDVMVVKNAGTQLGFDANGKPVDLSSADGSSWPDGPPPPSK